MLRHRARDKRLLIHSSPDLVELAECHRVYADLPQPKRWGRRNADQLGQVPAGILADLALIVADEIPTARLRQDLGRGDVFRIERVHV